MCNCDPRSAFHWHQDRTPSIFSTDGAFTPRAKSGKTASQISSEAVDRFTAKTGRNPGSVRGLSSAGDFRIEQAEYDRRAAR